MAYSTRSRNVTPYRATRHEANPDVVDLLVLILTPTIPLRGAACAGMAESFDLDAPRALHHLARQVCANDCPVAAQCAEWVAAQPDTVSGILAGHLHKGPQPTRRKRATA